MSSVRIVYTGCHTHCGNLARVETIWVMETDSTVDSDSTSTCFPHQILESPSHRLLAGGLSHQHGAASSVMTTWLARTGKTIGMR